MRVVIRGAGKDDVCGGQLEPRIDVEVNGRQQLVIAYIGMAYMGMAYTVMDVNGRQQLPLCCTRMLQHLACLVHPVLQHVQCTVCCTLHPILHPVLRHLHCTVCCTIYTAPCAAPCTLCCALHSILHPMYPKHTPKHMLRTHVQTYVESHVQTYVAGQSRAAGIYIVMALIVMTYI